MFGKVLTASIVLGWSLSVFTLGHWTALGYAGAVIASKQPLTQQFLISDSVLSHRSLRPRIRHSRSPSSAESSQSSRLNCLAQKVPRP